jgi:hypothetical protein
MPMRPSAFAILVGLALWFLDVARLAVRLALAGGPAAGRRRRAL